MKFNWGTGIVIFLILFMAAMLSFVIFAWRQDVNLVSKDYYEKGVDYSARIDINKRSTPYSGLISIQDQNDSVRILFPRMLASRIDTGNVLFFRPSDCNNDTNFPILFRDSIIITGKENLIAGRYIVKITWTTGGLEYEVDKTYIVN